MPFVMKEAGVSPEKRKVWARLIQKIYEVDSCFGWLAIAVFTRGTACLMYSPTR